MTANISSLYQGTGKQKAQILPLCHKHILSSSFFSPIMSLSVRAEQGYFLTGPDLALEGGLDVLTSPWRRGMDGVATPRVLP